LYEAKFIVIASDINLESIALRLNGTQIVDVSVYTHPTPTNLVVGQAIIPLATSQTVELINNSENPIILYSINSVSASLILNNLST
jgi:hypothetical protein